MSRDSVSGAALALAAVAALAGGAALRRGGRAIRLGSSREHDEARRVALQRGNKLYTVYGKSAQQAVESFEQDTGRKAVRAWVAPEALLTDAWIEYVIEAPPAGSKAITTGYTDQEYDALQKVLGFTLTSMNEVQAKVLLEEGRLVDRNGGEATDWYLVRLAPMKKRGQKVTPSRTLISGARVGPARLHVSWEEDGTGETFGPPWIESGYSAWRIPSGVEISEAWEDENDDEDWDEEDE